MFISNEHSESDANLEIAYNNAPETSIDEYVTANPSTTVDQPEDIEDRDIDPGCHDEYPDEYPSPGHVAWVSGGGEIVECDPLHYNHQVGLRLIEEAGKHEQD